MSQMSRGQRLKTDSFVSTESRGNWSEKTQRTTQEMGESVVLLRCERAFAAAHWSTCRTQTHKTRGAATKELCRLIKSICGAWEKPVREEEHSRSTTHLFLII